MSEKVFGESRLKAVPSNKMVGEFGRKLAPGEGNNVWYTPNLRRAIDGARQKGQGEKLRTTICTADFDFVLCLGR